jgi:hypothetical protein
MAIPVSSSTATSPVSSSPSSIHSGTVDGGAVDVVDSTGVTDVVLVVGAVSDAEGVVGEVGAVVLGMDAALVATSGGAGVSAGSSEVQAKMATRRAVASARGARS